MSVLCRIILFFYALAFGAVSVGVGALFTRIIPDNVIWNEFLYLCSRWETVGVAIIVFLCSLYLLIESFASHSKEVSANEAMIVQGKMGEVQISLIALKNMADKIARSTAGVRDVKVRLKMTKTATDDKALMPYFKMKLTVGEETNVVSTSDEIKYQIMNHLKNYIGIDKAKIDINIESISNSPAKNKRRVV